MQQFHADIERAPAALVAAFREQETATVYESNQQQGAMAGAIRPIAPGMRLCGSAFTVRCHPADNLTLHAAIALAQPGDVIVADVGGVVTFAHWGEIMAVAAQQRGVAGLVINGAVRDVGPMHRMGFAVFAAGVSMRGPLKTAPGWINHPIVCADVRVDPGDLVLADDDGVVVVARARAEAVLAAAQERTGREADLMERLRAGDLTVDLLGLRALLAAQNIHLPPAHSRGPVP